MHNRRRNRVNSTVVRRDGNRVFLQVDQSFGNCPKYIQVCATRAVAAAVQHMGKSYHAAVQEVMRSP